MELGLAQEQPGGSRGEGADGFEHTLFEFGSDVFLDFSDSEVVPAGRDASESLDEREGGATAVGHDVVVVSGRASVKSRLPLDPLVGLSAAAALVPTAAARLAPSTSALSSSTPTRTAHAPSSAGVPSSVSDSRDLRVPSSASDPSSDPSDQRIHSGTAKRQRGAQEPRDTPAANSEWVKRRRQQIARASKAARDKRKNEVEGLRSENRRLRDERADFLDKIQDLQASVEKMRESGQADMHAENELLRAQLDDHARFVAGFFRLAAGMPSSQLARRALYTQGADFAATHVLGLVSKSLQQTWMRAPLPLRLASAEASAEAGRRASMSACFKLVGDVREPGRRRLNLRLDMRLPPHVDAETAAAFYWKAWVDEDAQQRMYGLDKNGKAGSFEFKQLLLENLDGLEVADDGNGGNGGNGGGEREAEDEVEVRAEVEVTPKANAKANVNFVKATASKKKKNNNHEDNEKGDKEKDKVEAEANDRHRRRCRRQRRGGGGEGGGLVSAAYFREHNAQEKDKDWVFVATKRAQRMALSTLGPADPAQLDAPPRAGAVAVHLLARSTTSHLQAPGAEKTQRITSLLVEGCLIWSETDEKTGAPCTRLVTVLSMSDDVRLRSLNGVQSVLTPEGALTDEFGNYLTSFVQNLSATAAESAAADSAAADSAAADSATS